MFNIQNIISEILKKHHERINKNILYYNINSFYFNLFYIIKYKIEKIKILKYKNLIEYKELILFYNNFIKKYNLYIYGIKYEIFTIDLFKKKNINSITLIPEISPFKVSHDIYTNIIRSKSIGYKIKGFICFIVFRKTKRQEYTKIFIFNNNKHKHNNYYVYDIKEILDFVSSKLLLEIDILIKRDIYNNYPENNEDLYIGYLATLSAGITNYNKNDVIDILNFYNDNINSDLYIHIYFKIHQYKKNTNKYDFVPIKDNIINDLQYIFYNLEYNDNSSDPSILIKENNIYICSDCFIKTNFNNEYKIKVTKDLKLKIILNYKQVLFEYITDFKNLLYSSDFLYILLKNKEIYIPDIYIQNKFHENNELYKQINKKYILKRNNIIFKKNISEPLEMLLKIDTNVINWYDFINKSHKLQKNENLYEWFIVNYENYLIKNTKESYQISLSFKHLSIYDIFILVFNDNDFKNFIIYYSKYYKIYNKNIIKKTIIPNNNIKYDNFIDIIKIFLYLYNFN